MADLQELTPHVFLLKLMNATRTNIYVVREADGDTLIDPGPVGTAPAILALDRRREIRLQRLIVTHAHPAHAGSASRVVRGTGVRAYVHPLDAPYLDGRKPPLLPRGRRGQLMAALGRAVELCPPLFRLDRLTTDAPLGDLVPIGTPGHSPGHVCLFHPKDGVLFSGDALLTDGGEVVEPAPSLSSDPKRARASLEALREVPFRHLAPGHGAPLYDARDRVLSYLAAARRA